MQFVFYHKDALFKLLNVFMLLIGTKVLLGFLKIPIKGILVWLEDRKTRITDTFNTSTDKTEENWNLNQSNDVPVNRNLKTVNENKNNNNNKYGSKGKRGKIDLNSDANLEEFLKEYLGDLSNNEEA